MASLKVQALLIVDQAILDARTNKRTLVGVFNRIVAGGFPNTHPNLWLYASVSSEPNSTVAMSWRITGPSGAILTAGIGEITFPPEGAADIASGFAVVTFPSPATYQCELLADGRVVASAPLILETVPAESQA